MEARREEQDLKRDLMKEKRKEERRGEERGERAPLHPSAVPNTLLVSGRQADWAAPSS